MCTNWQKLTVAEVKALSPPSQRIRGGQRNCPCWYMECILVPNSCELRYMYRYAKMLPTLGWMENLRNPRENRTNVVQVIFCPTTLRVYMYKTLVIQQEIQEDECLVETRYNY